MTTHGTQSGYQTCNGGGRNACDECRAARARAVAEYRKRLALRRSSPTDWIDASQARAIVLDLRARGYSDPAIGHLAGISEGVPWGLRHGRVRITRENADRLLAARDFVDQRPGVLLNSQRVPSARTFQQIRSLSALGWPLWWQAQQLGHPSGKLPFRFDRPTVRHETARKVQELYDRISGTHGFSRVAADHARRLGWHVPMAYDDDGRLIPEAIPNSLSDARERRARRRERPAEVARLTAKGLTAEEIAKALGITPRTVVRDRARKAEAS